MATFKSVGGAFGMQRKVMAARLASARAVRPLTQEELFWNNTQREWDERIAQLSSKPAEVEVYTIRRKR